MELQPPKRAPVVITCGLAPALHRGLKLTVTAEIGSVLVRRAPIITSSAPVDTVRLNGVPPVIPVVHVHVHVTRMVIVRVHAAEKLAVRVHVVEKPVDLVRVRHAVPMVPVNALVLVVRMMKNRISSLSVVQRSSEKLDVSVVM